MPSMSNDPNDGAAKHVVVREPNEEATKHDVESEPEDGAANGNDDIVTKLDQAYLRKTVRELINEKAHFVDENGDKHRVSARSLITALAEGEAQEKNATKQWKHRTKLVAVFGIIAVIVAAAIQFAITHMANQISKDTKAVQSGESMILAGGDDGKMIMEVAPATSKLQLAHALVLDMDHLQTMDVVTYAYKDTNGRNVTASEKVLKVQRSQGTEKSDVVVEIVTQLQSKLVLSPQQAGPVLWVDGVSQDICGKLRCANFKIDDPNVNINMLDQKLKDLYDGVPDTRRLYTWTQTMCAISEFFA